MDQIDVDSCACGTSVPDIVESPEGYLLECGNCGCSVKAREKNNAILMWNKAMAFGIDV